MATPQNRNPVRTNNAKAKQNFTGTRQGNDHGSVSLGHIASDGAVTSAVQLQAEDGRHAIILDKDGPRKKCTQITAPGRISIQAGEDKKEPEDVMLIHTFNGNIDIIATNGKIRLQATDIELIARGSDGSKGNITMNASENIKFESKKFLVTTSVMYKLASSGTAEIVANSAMTIYSSCIRGVTDGVANRDSKLGGKDFQRKQTKK